MMEKTMNPTVPPMPTIMMGSSNEVRRVEELHCDPLLAASVSAPLFARRGFFRL